MIDALRLLEAVERLANPYAAWDGQHETTEKEEIVFTLQQHADGIIKLLTDSDGRINRTALCRIACGKAGRDLKADRVEKLFLREWLPQASESNARWKLFREMKIEADNEREELRSAITQGLSKTMISKLRKKVSATDARSFQSGGEFYPAAEDVDRRRKGLTDQELKAECEAFRLSFENGTHNQTRVVISEDHARAILIGTQEFTGFLEFIKFPAEKPKFVPTLPQARGASGTYTKPGRGSDGKMKPTRDVAEGEETPMPEFPNGNDERTTGKQWKKR